MDHEALEDGDMDGSDFITNYVEKHKQELEN